MDIANKILVYVFKLNKSHITYLHPQKKNHIKDAEHGHFKDWGVLLGPLGPLISAMYESKWVPDVNGIP